MLFRAQLRGPIYCSKIGQTLGTHLKSVQLALQVLFLVQQLLQSVSQYYVCVIQAAVLLVKLVVLIVSLRAVGVLGALPWPVTPSVLRQGLLRIVLLTRVDVGSLMAVHSTLTPEDVVSRNGEGLLAMKHKVPGSPIKN